ncbi:MAG: S9 family peptidase [Pseudomonadota bacterium]
MAVLSSGVRGEGLTAEIMLGLNDIGSAALSPDAGSAAYVEYSRSAGAALKLVDTETQETRHLVPQLDDVSSIAWADDGSALFFLAPAGELAQVWQLTLANGEAMPLTSLPVPVEGFRIAGGRLYVWASVYPDCEPLLACSAARVANGKNAETAPKAYDKLFVRHWDTWSDGRRRVLFTLGPLEQLEDKPRPLTAGLGVDVPAAPWGNPADVEIAADGRIYASVRPGDSSIAWDMNGDILRLDAAGRNAVNMTRGNAALDVLPRLSATGEDLYYLATAREGHEADRFSLHALELESGEIREITHDVDLSVEQFVVAPDGTVFFTAFKQGVMALFRIESSTGELRQLTFSGNVRDFDVQSGKILATIDSFKSPGDLWLLEDDGPRRLTEVNGGVLNSLTLVTPERFHFEGWRDERVEGYVFPPMDFDRNEQYPVLLVIHGGPQSSFWDRWDRRYQPQLFAAAGYAVLAIDFHGSKGYGQAFTDSISKDWGGKPLVDLKKGLAAAALEFPWLDTENSCAFGWSFGGYMTNWIASQWPDGFKCLITHAGIFDTRMMYYSTEELWFTEWEFGGPYFRVPEGHERQNPAQHVTSWTTPTLLSHGAVDFRVPLDQSVGAFTALQRLGIDSRFLYFPTDDHAIRSDEGVLLWYREVIDWLGEHTD